MPATALAAAFFGSTHCALMCGGIVAAVGVEPRALFAYQIGRLGSYSVVGAIAGAFGAGLFALLQSARVVWPVAVAFGLLYLLPGVSLWRGKGISVPGFTRLLTRAWNGLPEIVRRTAFSRGLALGVLTPLLPCGWLYAFVLVAAGTGTPLRGALVLAALWAGSLPALILAPTLLAKAKDRVSTPVRRAAAFLLILLGLGNLFGKVLGSSVNHVEAGSPQGHGTHCHR